MSKDEHVVLTFNSIHDVIKVEKIIVRHGIWCDLVPTPRELSSDCGMSIECRTDDLPDLESLRESGALEWRDIHRPE
jgi:putative Se/S carrier protein